MASSPKALVIAAAMAAVVVGALLLETASAANYKVGGDFGWDTGFDYLAWAKGKKFKVGDTLEFVYGSSEATHNVAVVDAQSYNACTAPSNAPTMTSGDDRVALDQAGEWYFICSVEGHCAAGMYLTINVK